MRRAVTGRRPQGRARSQEVTGAEEGARRQARSVRARRRRQHAAARRDPLEEARPRRGVARRRRPDRRTERRRQLGAVLPVEEQVRRDERHREGQRALPDGSRRVDFVGNYGRTALHFAAERADLAVVGELLEKRGAKITRDQGGETVLHRATCSHDVVGAKFLVARGIDWSIRCKDGKTAFDDTTTPKLQQLAHELAARAT